MFVIGDCYDGAKYNVTEARCSLFAASCLNHVHAFYLLQLTRYIAVQIPVWIQLAPQMRVFSCIVRTLLLNQHTNHILAHKPCVGDG